MTSEFNIRWDMPPAAIEAESFAAIEREFHGWEELPPAEWKVMRRLIHTTADLSIGEGLAFRHDPIPSALEALRRHCPIFCDSNMIRAGLSVERLRRAHPGYAREDIHCHISDADIAEQAKSTGRTRAICAAEKARPILDGAIVLIGNAPLSLARIARYALAKTLLPEYPSISFICIGDFIAESLQSAGEQGMTEAVVACMPGKLCKYAAGFANTHAHKVAQDMPLFLRTAERHAPLSGEARRGILACSSVRQALSLTPEEAHLSIYRDLAAEAQRQFQRHVPGLPVRFLISGFSGNLLLDIPPCHP